MDDTENTHIETTEDSKELPHVTTKVIERPVSVRKQMLIERIIENKGNVSKSMREVGYSESYAHNPQLVTKQPVFIELLEKKLPDKHLLKKHREFLDSKKIIRVYVKGDLKETTEETDSNAVKALDMVYKLKGRYQEKPNSNTLIINVSSTTKDRYKPVEARSESETMDTSTHEN